MADEAVVLKDRKLRRELNKKLSKLKSLPKDMTPLMAPTIFGDVMDHFSQEKGPQGSWKPWSQSYKEYMQRIGKSGNKILQDKGNLRQSLIPSKGKHKSTKDAGIFYTKVKYAAIHNFGKPGRMPQRRFMWISKQATDKLISIMLKHLSR